MMSARNPKAPATTKVYEHSTATGRHFEMLMSVAVFANPDGSSCFPSVAKITQKRFGATPRYGYKLIAELKAAGELEEVEKRPGRPTQYRVVCCTEDPSPGLAVVLDQQRETRRAKTTRDSQGSGVPAERAGQGYPGPPGVTPTPDPAESPDHSVDLPVDLSFPPDVAVLREGEGATDVQHDVGTTNGAGRASDPVPPFAPMSNDEDERPTAVRMILTEWPSLDETTLQFVWDELRATREECEMLWRLRLYAVEREKGHNHIAAFKVARTRTSSEPVVSRPELLVVA